MTRPSAGECERAGTWLGCKFRARYDRLALPDEVISLVATAIAYGPMTSSEAAALMPKIYVRDVCERCGRTLERGG